LDYLKGKYKKTGLLAFSLGGSVSINVLAKRHDVDSLVCVSTPSDFSKIDYQFWNLNFKDDLVYTLFTKEGQKGRGFRPGPFWLKKEKPIDNVGKIGIPVLYIHGEKDWVIRPWHSKALYEKTTSRKKIIMIKNGPHAEYLMKNSEEEFVSEIKNWFNQTLTKER
jgi:pimeloyl-ACP methyl ester carboxylesterase